MLLLVLTSADYVLWDWSIADGHDIVSLVAGLTLLPLAAVSVGSVMLTGVRVLRAVFGGSTRARYARESGASEHETHTSPADTKRSSNRLAA